MAATKKKASDIESKTIKEIDLKKELKNLSLESLVAHTVHFKFFGYASKIAFVDELSSRSGVKWADAAKLSITKNRFKQFIEDIETEVSKIVKRVHPEYTIYNTLYQSGDFPPLFKLAVPCDVLAYNEKGQTVQLDDIMKQGNYIKPSIEFKGVYLTPNKQRFGLRFQADEILYYTYGANKP